MVILNLLTECKPEFDSYGYTVTTNGAIAGSITEYTCRPGYNPTAGDTSRTCLPSLVWSGRRPTCQRDCSPIHPLTCNGCWFRPNSLMDMCTYSDPTNVISQSCAARTQEAGAFSVYYSGECRTSDCALNIDDAGSSTYWAFTHSCFSSKSVSNICIWNISMVLPLAFVSTKYTMNAVR